MERPWPEGLTRVPYYIYSDPKIYDREQERIFRGHSWNFICLSAEIPNPGDFVRSWVGETPVVAVRDKGGAVNVLVNRCSHRGLQFCQTQQGNAKAFTCPYHQWTFDLQGALRGIPFKKGVNGQGGLCEDFDQEGHGLERLNAIERHETVFASFDFNMPTFETYLGKENLHYFDRVFNGKKLRVLGKQRQRVNANWKLVLENIKDPYHATLLHVFFVTFGLWRADLDYSVRFDDSGGTAIQFSQPPEKKGAVSTEITNETTSMRSDLKLADPRIVDAVKEFSDDKQGAMHTIWPNLIIQQTLNSLATRHAVPAGPDAFDLHWTFFGYEDDTPELNARRLRHANLYGPAGLVSVDDAEVLRLVQRGASLPPSEEASIELGGKGAEDTDFMVTEVMIRGFYKCYRRIMEI
jgi:salicylate 5-hydroxylase large subunit